jgi:hypothetical protein
MLRRISNLAFRLLSPLSRGGRAKRRGYVDIRR